MNRVTLIGNLGKNPELRNTGKTSVVNFSVATTERFTDSEGKPQRSTQWHNVVAFGAQADAIAKHLQKGSKVAIEGRLQTRNYEKDGVKKYVTEVVASDVEFLDAKGGEKDTAPEGEPAAA